MYVTIQTIMILLVLILGVSINSAFHIYSIPFKKNSLPLAYSPYEEQMDHETTKDSLLSYVALHSSTSPFVASFLNETKLQQKLLAIEEFQTRNDIVYNFPNLAGVWTSVYSNVNNNFNNNVTLKELSFGVFNESNFNLKIDNLKQEINSFDMSIQSPTENLVMDYNNVITFMENPEDFQKLTIKGKATVMTDQKDIMNDYNSIRLNVTFYEVQLEKKVLFGGSEIN